MLYKEARLMDDLKMNSREIDRCEAYLDPMWVYGTLVYQGAKDQARQRLRNALVQLEKKRRGLLEELRSVRSSAVEEVAEDQCPHTTMDLTPAGQAFCNSCGWPYE